MPSKQAEKQTGEEYAYAKFLQGLNLLELPLRNCSANLDREAYWNIYKKGKTPAHTLTQTYKVAKIGDGFFTLEGYFGLALSDSGSENKTAVLKLDCTFEVHVHSVAPIDNTFIQRFTRAELGHILVPYARHFVANITGQLGIPPLVIPLGLSTDDDRRHTEKGKKTNTKA
jgi:preprotein translocase subunit SecB